MSREPLNLDPASVRYLLDALLDCEICASGLCPMCGEKGHALDCRLDKALWVAGFRTAAERDRARANR